jgi:hypothetical protein
MPGVIEARLAAEHIDWLYHFTSVENLPGIAQQQALCSTQFLGDHGLAPMSPGGNALSLVLDGHHGTLDFVHIYFTPYTPMAYRKKRDRHICWFVLKPAVADRDGVEFTDCNAAANVHQQVAGSAGLELLDFAILRGTPQPGSADWKKRVQAELLAPSQVPMSLVQEIAFVSRASLEEGERLWGATPHPTFTIRPALFSDWPGGTVESIGFAHVETVLLTPDLVTMDNALMVRAHQSEYQRTAEGVVYVVASVRVTAGSKAETSVNDGPVLQTTVFDQSRRFIYFPAVGHADMPNEVQGITIRLNGVRWVTIPCTLKV